MLFKRGETPEIPISTIPSLNKKLWGFRRGEVTIIGARTSNGKSAFVNQLAWDCAVNKNKVLYLSLEMPVDRLIERLFCYIEKIDNLELLHGQFSKNKLYQDKWFKFKALIASRNIVFCDYIGKTWKEIDNTIEKLSIKPDVLIVDHIHHIRMNGNSMSEKQTIDEYLEHFRELVIRNNFVGILNAQINRVSQEDKEGEPQLHHLKSTGKLEEIADNALLLWWPWHSNQKKPKNLFKINIAKNRYGSVGKLDLNFEPEFFSFSDAVFQEEIVVKRPANKWEDSDE